MNGLVYFNYSKVHNQQNNDDTNSSLRYFNSWHRVSKSEATKDDKHLG